MQFYTIYEAYQTFALLLGTIVTSFSYLTLAQLNAKGKAHYRAWLLPFTLGNTITLLMLLWLFVRTILHIHTTVSMYYADLSAQALIFILALYGSVRLWLSVKNSAPVPPPRPTSDLRDESPTVWPPSPRPPGNDQ